MLAFTVIVGVGALIGSQLAHLAENLPGYQLNITEKIHSLRDTTITGSGVVGRAVTMLSDLGNEITRPRETADRTAAAPAALAPSPRRPISVEIHQSDPSPLQLIVQV